MNAIDALDTIETAIITDRRAWAYICWNREACDEDGPAYLVTRGDELGDSPADPDFTIGSTRIYVEDTAAANIIGSILAEAAREFDR